MDFFRDLFAGPALALIIALVIDLSLGELPNWGHPVVWMGKMIAGLERFAPRAGRVPQFLYGAVIAVAIPGAFTAGVVLLGWVNIPGPIELLVGALVLKSTFALRALGTAALDMKVALASPTIDEARAALRSLCSRDPSQLQPPALIAGTVESVAENASDSFVAPIF
jgi:adenosylcobinamide-phosphate synthase